MNLSREFVLMYLSEGLTPFFVDKGYEWLAGKQQFRLSTPPGFRNLIVSVSPYDDLVLVEWHIGLRVDAIEDMVKRFTRTLPGFYPDAHSCLISQGKLLGKPYLRHAVKKVEELDALQDAIRTFWDDTATTFLDTHHSIAGVDGLLNEDPTSPSRYLPNQAHRCLKGIVAARLNQRPNFETLVQQYDATLQRTPTGDLLLDGFRRLSSYLQKMSLN